MTTTLTNEEAIAALRDGSDGVGFASDCADHIEIMAMREAAPAHLRAKLRVRENLVAWGFRIADEKVNRVVVMLSETVRKRVAFRKPMRGKVAGECFKVALCGSNSKHTGKYSITDGGPFGDNRFYGYAEANGTWSPAHVTPEEVIAELTK